MDIEKMKKNSGVIIIKPTKTDFVVGAITYEQRTNGDWTPYLPLDERQSFRRFDSMACVSFSALNSCEMQLNLLLPTLPLYVKKWLQDEGYIVNGKLEFSDRYLAKMSGTTLKGNTLPKVWDAIRHYGLVPEVNWPSNDDFNRTEYFAEVPAYLIEKGKKFLEFFDIEYEWVHGSGSGISATRIDFTKHLKHAPIQIATAVCGNWGEGIIAACWEPCAHATCIFYKGGYLGDEDTYAPFQKQLASNYIIYQAMKGVISLKSKEVTTEMVRAAWNADPEVKREYPAANKFYSINDPEYSIYDWAQDWGKWDHPQFQSGYQITEKVVQVEGTDYYFLIGPGGGDIKDPTIVENAEVTVLSPTEAREEIGLTLNEPIVAEPIIPKKKSLIKLIKWLISLFGF